MVLLAALVWLPTRAIGIIGLSIIVFQNVFEPLGRMLPESWRWLWEFIYPVGVDVTIGQHGPSVAVLYTIVPWIGVMAAGYAFGAIMVREPADRRRLCLRIGLSATALFVVAAGLGVLLSSPPADAPPALFRFLNQRKYPASLLFLLMTLGPTIALLPVAERTRGWLAAPSRSSAACRCSTICCTFRSFMRRRFSSGTSATALSARMLRDGSVRLDSHRRALGTPLLYLVFAIVVALLYVACRWFASVKARRQGGWLRYV